jgi:hypothetical protein
MTDTAMPSAPLITGDRTLSDVTRDICAPLERRPGRLWWAGFIVSSSLLLLGTVAVVYQVTVGIGTWGLNRTVGWAFDITNFVFWIGIGHAGTLISLSVPSEMADIGKPFGGSHDFVRCHVCRHLSADSHGAPLACVLDYALPKHPRTSLGEFSLSAGLGLFCH